MSEFRIGKIRRDEVRGYLQPFCPIEATQSILDVKPADLVAAKKKLVLLDVDNTLVEWRSEDIPLTTFSWIESIKAAGLQLCILSNTRHPDRLRRLTEKLKVPFLMGRFKPSRSMYRQALEKFGVKESEAVMIGDQLFTDVLGANRTGIEAIWVKQMAPVDFAGTRISRFGERLLRKRLYRHMAELDKKEGSEDEDLPAGGSAAFELLQVPIVRQFLKFCIVGASSSVVDIGLTVLLMYHVPYGTSLLSTELGNWLISHYPGLFSFAKDAPSAALPFFKVPAAGLAILNGFIWNRRWTFKIRGKEHRSVQLRKFFTVALIGLALNTLTTTALYNILPGTSSRRMTIASVVAIVVVSFWNFFGQKFWTFRHKH